MNLPLWRDPTLKEFPDYFAACRTSAWLSCMLDAPETSTEAHWSFSLPLGVYPVVDVISTVIQNGPKETDFEGAEQYLFGFFDQVETAAFLWLIQKEQTLWKAHEWPYSHKYVVGHEKEGEQMFIELSMLKCLYDLPEGDAKLRFANAWDHLYALLLERYCYHTAPTDTPVRPKEYAAYLRAQKKRMGEDQNPYEESIDYLRKHWDLFEIVGHLVKVYRESPSKNRRFKKLNQYWNDYADVLKERAKQLKDEQGIWKGLYTHEGRVIFKDKRNQTVKLSPEPYSKKNISGRGRKPGRKSK